MSYTKEHRISHRLRLRIVYLGVAIITILIGLLINKTKIVPSDTARDVIGDALWAMMIVWWLGFLVPKYSLNLRNAIALLICWIVEFSQIYHAPMLDAVRQTTIGHLMLGSGFDPRDLFSYAVGVVMALVIELVICRNNYFESKF